MNHSRSSTLVTALFALLVLGAGCVAPTAETLPTAPPDSARLDLRTDDAAPAEEVPSVTEDDTTASTSEETVQTAPVLPADTATDTSKAPAGAEPYYIGYSAAEFDRARAEGRPIALYFWAAWCPICRAEEPLIKEQIEGLDLPVAGFRVDFDTEAELKKIYKIPYQHTLVILDTEGNETTRFLGPAENDVRYAAYLDAYTR